MKTTVRAFSHYLPITSRFAAALKSQDELDVGTEQTSEVPGIDTEIEPTQTEKLEQDLAPPAEPPSEDAQEPAPDAPITAQEVIDYMNKHAEIIGEEYCNLYPEENLRGFRTEALVEVYRQSQIRVNNAQNRAKNAQAQEADSGQTGLPLEGSEN